MNETSGALQTTRRGRGRPKGLPRTGGRQKGTLNRLPSEVREHILNKYAPHVFLGRCVLGLKMRVGPQAGPNPVYEYPSIQQRLYAAEILAKKVLPDLKSSELSGPEATPLIPEARPIDDAAFKGALIALWREAAK